jgi:hypothetical protein
VDVDDEREWVGLKMVCRVLASVSFCSCVDGMH